jgi:hypothetical protein
MKIFQKGAYQPMNMNLYLGFRKVVNFKYPGSHVGFQISTKNTNLVEDHPVNISGKFG